MVIKLYKVEDETEYSNRWFTTKKKAEEYLHSIRGTYDEASLYEAKLKFSAKAFVCSLMNKEWSETAEIDKTLICRREFWKEV
jgi:hypothetical protein